MNDMDKYIQIEENIIDIEIDNIKHSEYDFFLTRQKLFIKIDKRGNINVQKQIIYVNQVNQIVSSCVPNRYGRLMDVLVINDNIEIPDYLINMIIKLFTPDKNLYIKHYDTIIESIRILKNSLRLEFSDSYYSDCFEEIV